MKSEADGGEVVRVGVHSAFVDDLRSCRLALAMAHHRRLGEASPLRAVPTELLERVFDSNLRRDVVVLSGGVTHSLASRVMLFDVSWSQSGALNLRRQFALKSLGTPVAGHAMMTLGTHVVVVGGHDGEGSLSATRMLSLETNTWRELAPMQEPRHGGLVSGVVGEKLVVGGGKKGRAVHKTSECFIPQRNEWVPYPSMEQPRYGAASVVLEGVLYAFGGAQADANLKKCERFDERTGKWERVKALPITLYGSSAAVQSPSSLILCGGCGVDKYTQAPITSSRTHIYEVRMDKWRDTNMLRYARECAACVTVQNRTLVLGGKSNLTKGPLPCEVFDNALERWEALDEVWPAWHSGATTAWVG